MYTHIYNHMWVCIQFEANFRRNEFDTSLGNCHYNTSEYTISCVFIHLQNDILSSKLIKMTEFLPPPPTFSVPPPPVQQQQPIHTSPQQNQSPSAPHYQNYQRERHYHGGFAGKSTHFRPYNNFRGPNNMSQDDFDGKRLRKSVMRKTVDYNSSIVRELEVK